MKDHYKILGVGRASSQDEVKRAYRRMALQYHPDRNGGSRHSEELFRQVSESYIILGDISSRKVYDDWLTEQERPIHESTGSGSKITPATFHTIFRNIRERVFNAGGSVNGDTLFDIINAVLTTENLNYLVQVRDIRTNGMIIDEILVSSVFLDNRSKRILYRKLIRLAHGDEALREKVSVLSNVEHRPTTKPINKEKSWDEMYLFIVTVIVIIVFAIMAAR
jgi:molecular chaperone DnaJ